MTTEINELSARVHNVETRMAALERRVADIEQGKFAPPPVTNSNVDEKLARLKGAIDLLASSVPLGFQLKIRQTLEG